jgi:hypothetical protein
MRHQISSSITAVFKVLLLLFIVIIISLNLIGSLMTPDSRQFFFTSLSMLLGFFIARWALTWKKVEIAEKGIFVTEINFGNGKEIFVPYEQIEIVKQNILGQGSPEFVSIKFLGSTSFGDKIWFVPKTRFFTFFNHPIVKEMNRLVQKNKGLIT